MTAGELIEKLKGFDPNLPVVACRNYDNNFEVGSVAETAKVYATATGRPDGEWGFTQGACVLLGDE